MFPFDKLRIVLILVAVGLFCSVTLVLPARDIFLYSLSFTLSGRMLLGLILVGLTCTGVETIVQGHSAASNWQTRSSTLHWILPSALTVAAWALLPRIADIRSKVIGIIAASMSLAVLIIAEYYTIEFIGRRRAVLQFALHLAAYLLATLLYAAIRLDMPAPTATALAMAAVSATLGLRLICDGEEYLPQHVWLYVLGLSTLLGLTSWLLYSWLATPLLHSLFLVVLLYVLTGLLRQWLSGRLTRRVVIEYWLVGLAALLLLLSYVR